MENKIKVAISACLLGQPVRFNGQHKRSKFCVETLSEWFEYLPICPEVEIGLGVPREPIRLLHTASHGVRAVNIKDAGIDHTEALHALADAKQSALQSACGYIFMQKSPSCGAFRVKVYDQNGIPGGKAAPGIYAAQVQHNHPWLPVEEAGRLNDNRLRENFIIRVFALHDWHNTLGTAPSPKALVQFHTRYKYLLMAHSNPAYQALGQMVAEAGSTPLDKLLDRYFHGFMHALSKPAKAAQHINVMHHVFGYLKKCIDAEAKQAILAEIERYREEAVNLIVPLTLLKHYVKVHRIDYLMQQKYLSPYPYELGLRNWI